MAIFNSYVSLPEGKLLMMFGWYWFINGFGWSMGCQWCGFNQLNMGKQQSILEGTSSLGPSWDIGEGGYFATNPRV